MQTAVKLTEKEYSEAKNEISHCSASLWLEAKVWLGLGTWLGLEITARNRAKIRDRVKN
jgi:hypothetical protein